MSTTPAVPRRRVERSHRRSAPSDPGILNATVAGTGEADLGLFSGLAEKPCPYFNRGNCRFGDRCKMRHDSMLPTVPAANMPRSAPGAQRRSSSALAAAVITSPIDEETSTATPPSPPLSPPFPVVIQPKRSAQPQPHTPSRQKPCYTWRRKGSCVKGDQCPFAHTENNSSLNQSSDNNLVVPPPSLAGLTRPISTTASISESGSIISPFTAPSIVDMNATQVLQPPQPPGYRRAVGKQRRKREKKGEGRRQVEREKQREEEEAVDLEGQRAAAASTPAQKTRKEQEREAEAQKEAVAVEAEARRKAELETIRKAELEARRKDLELKEIEAKRKALELELEMKRKTELAVAEKHRADALVTIRRVQLGSTLVTFGAGVKVGVCAEDPNQEEEEERIRGIGVIPGFETCRVVMRNIPLGAKIDEVREFLDASMGAGLNANKGKGKEKENRDSSYNGRFLLVTLKRWNHSQEGVIIAHGETGKDMIQRLDGVYFRNSHRLKFELNETGGATAGMNVRRNGSTLRISWRPPSSRYALTYDSGFEADEKIRRFNGTMVFGRRVKVERDLGAGRATVSRLPLSGLSQILVTGLPVHLEDEDIRNFFDGRSARKIFSSPYDEFFASAHLKNLCASIAHSSPEFDEPHDTHGDHTLYARFNNWDDAKRVYDSLLNQKFAWIGHTFFHLSLPDPIQYEISIPYNQYRVQLTRWRTFLADTMNKRDINMRIIEKPERYKVFVHVAGTDAKVVGTLKVRVEHLAAGEKLHGLWHKSFFSDSGKAFLRSLEAGDVLVLPDWRYKSLKAFGDARAIERVREAIERELERLAGMEYTTSLKRASVSFFTKRGVADLKERFGEENVSLNISSWPCRITIRGGEDARHALRSLIDQSLNEPLPPLSTGEGSYSEDSAPICPICLDQVSVPVQLGCGHVYCSACLHHFFTADVKTFPIVCLGDDAQCRKPIALPVIQKFLTEVQFDTLLETAFMQYIEKNPDIFRYCTTPDCERLYRCASSGESSDACATNLRCPSCFSEICSRCHEEHEGMTCDERQRARYDQANNEELNTDWAAKSGVKRCPKCSVWIEKTEGCNHITCRCGAHVCWRCLGIFDAQTIYTHMNTAHGGIGLDDGVAHVDYNRQVRELADAFVIDGGVDHDMDYNAQARELENWHNLAAARRAARVVPPRNYLQARYAAPGIEERDGAVRLQQEQMQIQATRMQEQRMRTFEAAPRRTRQEEGGNWCTIM